MKQILHFSTVTVLLACFSIQTIQGHELQQCTLGPRFRPRSHYRHAPFEWCCWYYDRRKSTKVMDCGYRDPSNFDQITFDSDLKSLTFTRSTVREETNKVKYILDRMPGLKHLDLSMAQVYQLPENFFNNNDELESIDLSWNGLTEVSENLFSHNTKLKVVKLSGNDLRVLPLNIFQHNPDLEEVWIERNKIAEIHEGHFANNTKLHTIIMSHNPIRVIDPNSFQNNKDLTTVDLSSSGSFFPRNYAKKYCKIPNHYCDGHLAGLPLKLRMYHTSRQFYTEG